MYLLHGTIGQCLTENMTLEQRPEKMRKPVWYTYKQNIPKKGSSKCKCLEVGSGLVSSMKSQVSMAGEKGTTRTVVGDNVKKVATGQLV